MLRVVVSVTFEVDNGRKESAEAAFSTVPAPCCS